MSVAPKLRTFLEEQDVEYEVLSHPHTGSSQRTAEEAHVSGDRLAKAVLLENDAGERVLAVLPASRAIYYPEIDAHLGTWLKPVEEDALQASFPDCEPGALPACGLPYGLKTVVDAALLDEDLLYFEAGDHRSVVKVRATDFRRLLADADVLAFSAPPA
jgi:Ala-tRNA(Pro) deacylase